MKAETSTNLGSRNSGGSRNHLYPPVWCAAFRVAASGATPISYQWYKVAGVTTNIIAGATSDTLWVSNLKVADSGVAYFARVTNAFVVTNTDQAILTINPRAVNVPLTGYARIVAADKPSAYWRLDETTGSTLAVDAVGSFDGTYAGGSDLTFSWPTGILANTRIATPVIAYVCVSLR